MPLHMELLLLLLLLVVLHRRDSSSLLTSPLDCLPCLCISTFIWYRNDVAHFDWSEPLPLRRSRVSAMVDSVGTAMSGCNHRHDKEGGRGGGYSVCAWP